MDVAQISGLSNWGVFFTSTELGSFIESRMKLKQEGVFESEIGQSHRDFERCLEIVFSKCQVGS